MDNALNDKKVCPVEIAGGLDNSFRKLIQNPRKILSPYIKDGMTVLDLGCGPGFFSLEIANLLEGSGKVIAADLQDGMLNKVRKKIEGTELESKVILHKCDEDSINLEQKVDFVLAFYMIHEVPNQTHLFKELKSILNPNGELLIIEPKFHVTKKAFNSMISNIESIGFKIKEHPSVFFSRAILLEN